MSAIHFAEPHPAVLLPSPRIRRGDGGEVHFVANDGYYSEWQVKPETLKSWSKFCLKKEVTPAEFENSQLARQVVSCVTQRELKGQLAATNNNETEAVRRTACWWMTGEYKGCDRGFTADYVKKVLGYYQKLKQST